MSSEETRGGLEPDPSETTVGLRLKILRTSREFSIDHVSEITHISRSNIRAIEEEMFENLPADTFVRGLVSIYGDFLGIDGAAAAKEFIEERDRQLPRGRRNRYGSGRSLRPKKLAEPSHVSSATVASILLIFIVASFSAFCVYSGWNPFSYFLEQKEQAPAPLSEVIEQQSGTPAPSTTGTGGR
jgi:cytoskeletal protein RodZ